VAKVLLVIAVVVGLSLAALLIGMSRILFGLGPESMHGGGLLTLAYAATVIACLASPVAGFVFHKYGKTGLWLVLAWLPPAGALVALMIPAPY
jgi:hypothetical protein